MKPITDRHAGKKVIMQASAIVKQLPPMPDEWQIRHRGAYAVYRKASIEWDISIRDCPASHDAELKCDCNPNSPVKLELNRTAAIVNTVSKEQFDRDRAVYNNCMEHASRAWHAKQKWKRIQQDVLSLSSLSLGLAYAVVASE